MRIIKVGKYYALRHWFRWYWVHQEGGGSNFESNRLVPMEFDVKEIE